MGSFNIRTDEAMEIHRDTLIAQAQRDAERLAADPDDQAEIVAIQRFMGVAE